LYEIIQKNKVSPSNFSLSPLPFSLFALPMPYPWKSLTKSARAAGNPVLSEKIKPVFAKFLSAEAKLDVCPPEGKKCGRGGCGAWGEKVVKIAGPMRAFLVER
jgi:hypothetical protein